MTEQRIELPSGGAAWITSEATHGQMKAIRLARYRLERFRTAGHGEARVWREMTEAEEQDRDRLVLDETDLYIRTFTARWEGVHSPSGEELALPDDLDRMAERDTAALFEAILDTQARADPNAEGRPSPSTSPPESSPATPTSEAT